MVSINRSFVYGICFASLTWMVSLFLYLQLTKTDNVSTNSSVHYVWPVKNNVIDDFNNFKKSLIDKSSSYFQKNNYANSNKFIEQLQPKVMRSNADSDLSELGMVRTKEDEEVRDTGYKVHAYNVLVSNHLSYHRSVLDTRNELCKNLTYPDPLPTASIIICFYNEHFQTLLRTVHSILDRTPPALLKEILLIDDFSDIANLHNDVKSYISVNSMDKVKLVKTERREGLIRARIFGSRKAEGDVLIFLDSHVEVNMGWVEPLLARIKQNRTNVVMPVIDVINADTFAYSSSPLVRGGFNWGLHFKWENLPKGTLSKREDFVKPIKSPTMAGGLFAIDRKYFKEMGEYDAGMNIWGGENLEISFRIWLCGGQLELLPCSRVGHVFRHRRPYGAPDGQDTMLHNSLRVAHVWMDDYKDYFLQQRPDAKRIDYGDISSRIQLRKELKCYDFDWYLKHVYPELTLPNDTEERLKHKWAALERDEFQPWHSRKRNYVGQFQLRLSNTTLCLQSAKDVKSKGSGLILKPCIRSKVQMWYQTDKQELVLAQLLCLQSGKASPILYKCHEMGGDQEWKHKGENKSPIYNIGAGTCLGVKKKEVNSSATMRLCTDPDLSTWDLVR